ERDPRRPGGGRAPPRGGACRPDQPRPHHRADRGDRARHADRGLGVMGKPIGILVLAAGAPGPTNEADPDSSRADNAAPRLAAIAAAARGLSGARYLYAAPPDDAVARLGRDAVAAALTGNAQLVPVAPMARGAACAALLAACQVDPGAELL